MTFKVNLFFGDELIAPSEYGQVQICSKTVDRIVNAIYDKANKDIANKYELDDLDDDGWSDN